MHLGFCESGFLSIIFSNRLRVDEMRLWLFDWLVGPTVGRSF